MLDNLKLPSEQFKQKLSQTVTNLYITELGHKPQKVTCQLTEQNLTIVIEDAITLPEQLLVNSEKKDLAKQVRTNINQALQPKLKALVEDATQLPIVDILTDSSFDTNCTSIVVILAAIPTMYDP